MPTTITVVDVTPGLDPIGFAFESLPLTLYRGDTYTLKNASSATVTISFGVGIDPPTIDSLQPSGEVTIEVVDNGTEDTPVPYGITVVSGDGSTAVREWAPPAGGGLGGDARIVISSRA